MTRDLTGRSELAGLADDLSVRARVCLALLGGDIALQHLEGSPEFSLARDTLGVVLKWHKDGRVDLDKWEDLFEDALGFAQLRAKARSEAEGLAWLVLEHPVCYATYYAFHEASRSMPLSLVGSDTELSLDYLDKDLRRLAPSAMALMIKAAAYLKQHPDALLAQLKADISKP